MIKSGQTCKGASSNMGFEVARDAFEEGCVEEDHWDLM